MLAKAPVSAVVFPDFKSFNFFSFLKINISVSGCCFFHNTLLGVKFSIHDEPFIMGSIIHGIN